MSDENRPTAWSTPVRMVPALERPHWQGGRALKTTNTIVVVDDVRQVIPTPMVDLGDGIVGLPQIEATEWLDGPAVRMNLHVWSLRDVDRERNLGIQVKNAADAYRVADRYKREARNLPETDLSEWTARLVAEEQSERGGR
jgi:hypothetical protein